MRRQKCDSICEARYMHNLVRAVSKPMVVIHDEIQVEKTLDEFHTIHSDITFETSCWGIPKTDFHLSWRLFIEKLFIWHTNVWERDLLHFVQYPIMYVHSSWLTFGCCLHFIPFLSHSCLHYEVSRPFKAVSGQAPGTDVSGQSWVVQDLTTLVPSLHWVAQARLSHPQQSRALLSNNSPISLGVKHNRLTVVQMLWPIRELAGGSQPITRIKMKLHRPEKKRPFSLLMNMPWRGHPPIIYMTPSDGLIKMSGKFIPPPN